MTDKSAGHPMNIQQMRPTFFEERLSQRSNPFVKSPRAQDAPYMVVETTIDSPDANPGDGVCADSGNNCSLRAAVMEGNAAGNFVRIYLNAGTYTLTAGQLDITATDVEIYGQEQTREVIISGNNASRVFQVDTGASVAFENLTITGGNSGNGGGLYNLGAVQLMNVEITGNHAVAYGGGISNIGGYIEAYNVTIYNNTSSQTSAGIDNFSLNANAKAELHLYNVTISGNVATGAAGGLFSDDNSIAELNNVTIASNTSGVSGGGILVDHISGATLAFQNTIIAQNTAPASPDCQGNIDSVGFNLMGNNSGCNFFAFSSDIVGTNVAPVNALLSPLEYTGGYVSTHGLQLNSPARDNGDDDDCEETDARGVVRAYDGDYDSFATCDIGAYEFVPEFTVLFAPLASDYLDTPQIPLAWSKLSGATKYIVSGRAPGTAYKFKYKIDMIEDCLGEFCGGYIPLTGVPNNATIEWRIKAVTPTGNESTVARTVKTRIPEPTLLWTPQDFSMFSDTTPLFIWDNNRFDDQIDAYRVVVQDIASKTNVISHMVNETSSPSLADVCPAFAANCELRSDQIGAALTPGRSYRWMVISYATFVDTKKYKSKSLWSYFDVITDDDKTRNGFLPLPQTSQ